MKTQERETLSIYIPKKKMALNLLARLNRLGKILDRSINYMVVAAIEEYLDYHEKDYAGLEE